jgi:hypothetical protein
VPPFVLTVLKISLLVLLYLFIWRSVRAIVLDLYGPRRSRRTNAKEAAPARRRNVPTRVVVLNERGGKAGSYRLNGTLEIGRAASCEIRPEDTYISQQHARISSRNGDWVVEDLGSTNGTYLNQRRVTAPAELSPGDRIRVGKTTIEVRR